MIALDDFFAENPCSQSTRETIRMRWFALMPLRRFVNLYPNDILKFFKLTGWGSSLRYTAATPSKNISAGSMVPLTRAALARPARSSQTRARPQ